MDRKELLMARLGLHTDKKYDKFIAEMMMNRKPAVDACRDHPTEPCDFLEKDSDFCRAYMDPESRWRLGNCPLATHIKTTSSKKKRFVLVSKSRDETANDY